MSDVDDLNCECETASGYQTLAQLRRRMLIRGGYAAVVDSPPPGVVTLIDEFLQGAQNSLYRDFDALRTERFFKWTMVTGQRFYAFDESDAVDCPAVVDPYLISWVGFEDLNGAWFKLSGGIDPEEYTRLTTTTGYPERYEIRSCIEIFPAPQSAMALWVKGHFTLAPLTDAAHRTTIDSELVFLLALGRLQQDRGKPAAAGTLKDADRYLQRLVAGAHSAKRYVPAGFDRARNATRPLLLPTP